VGVFTVSFVTGNLKEMGKCQQRNATRHRLSRHTDASCQATSAMSLPVININVNYEDEKGL
jgi:hypothetical protein